MDPGIEGPLGDEGCRRWLRLALLACREFVAQCSWSPDPDRSIGEDGGRRGDRIVAELCR